MPHVLEGEEPPPLLFLLDLAASLTSKASLLARLMQRMLVTCSSTYSMALHWSGVSKIVTKHTNLTLQARTHARTRRVSQLACASDLQL